MTRAVAPTAGEWRRFATTQTMHDGTVLPTWGVVLSGTEQWVGRVHPIGSEPHLQAEARANALLFAASKALVANFREATEVGVNPFDKQYLTGVELQIWFAQRQLRAKAAIDVAGVP